MKQQQLLVVGISIVVFAVLAVWYFARPSTTSVTQEVSTDEPVDIVMEFFGSWLQAVESPDTNPYQEGVAEHSILSAELRARLQEAQNDQETDSVLCQAVTPSQLASRMVYEQDDTVQLLVFSKEPRQPGQSVVTLKRLNDGWYIHDIECAQETAGVVGEYTFEARSGLLLKESVPAPFDASEWHLGYTEQEVYVKVIPIILDTDSMCVDAGGAETVCDVEQFVEITQVALQGDMTEAGVLIKRLTFLQ